MSPLDTQHRNPEDALDTLIVPRARDLGGFHVRRALPSARRQMVGPFIFLDQMGPAHFDPGHGIDVRPHPHIGLSTVTYLYQGSILHADSLGTVQDINPGEVNWMTAGRGITHSERTRPALRDSGFALSGFQTWVALPEQHEDMAPDFEHHKREALPLIQGEGKQVRLILGELYGARAPAKLSSPLFYADADIGAGQSLPLDQRHMDRAVFVVSGTITLGKDTFESGQLLVLRPGDALSLTATRDARVLLLGGDPLEGPRHIWWNFVSSSLEKLEHAKHQWQQEDWEQGQFTLPPSDNAEHIPLPAN